MFKRKNMSMNEKMQLPTCRLELDLERLMIAELAPSASYKTHKHTHTCTPTHKKYGTLLVMLISSQ